MSYDAELCVNKCRFWSDCPNMKDREGDLDMEREHYECKVCNQHDYLDYEDMK